ncbi:ComEC/Rec2 family competence protein [Pelagicoccus sp. SDUM812005]|uniref:ComEC/Rec2 family competence protein n=1 Tax=Pelagicoccus sp. SDUM812005 TaxID=3041257 RepID=UPI00280F72E0|nr:ComEC/Rec2 family competence protein [Pelagicoccus sp. SDUM812005]MDQ8181937.1 ComEC/Rec2 family competence protein [Pelagicoccus sp. SDUM812005]
MPQATKPRRVPLLWILLPYALGIGIARFLPLPNPWILLSASALGLGFANHAAKDYNKRWHLALVPSVALLGAARFLDLHLDPQDQIAHIPREAALQLEIDTLFNATDPDTALGIARVVVAPIQQSELSGLRIFFFLDTDSLADYPREGERFSALGVIRPLPSYSQGDRFDSYLRNQGISHAYKQGFLQAKTASAAGLSKLTNRIKEKFADALSQNKRPHSPLTGAYKGLMLGQKSELTPEQKQLFLANGTMHLFAISGLHIGVIAICLHQLLSLLRLKSGVRALAALSAIACFVLVTGGSASSWRALLMVACFYLTSFGYKQASPINALALSALIYLLLLPGQLFQAGFQMSYLTVSAILLFGLPLGKTLNELLPLFSDRPHAILNTFQRVIVASKKWILDALGVSTAAFLISALLGIYYFQILPSYGILINLVALPIASLAIIAGFLSLLLSPLIAWIPISALFNNAALFLIQIIHTFLELTSKLPAASIATPAVPAPWAAIALLTSLCLVSVAYSQAEPQKARLWQACVLVGCAAWIFLLPAL